MRTVTLAICCFFLQTALSAQSAITVLSGQVLYYPQTGSVPLVKGPGTQFELKGKIRCKGNESARLVYNGYRFWVKGSKLRNAQDVVNAATRANEMSFTGRFFNFLTESVKEGESTENVKKYHRKYMEKTSGGVKGWAKPGYSIRPLPLSSGKLPSANVIFKWRNTAGEGPYSFTLYTWQNIPVAQLQVRDTAITLDLDQLALNLDEEYSWAVTRGNSAKSAPLAFEICQTCLGEKQTDLINDADYQSATPFEQQLMLAYQLEEEHCFYAANSTYMFLLASEPDNGLYRKMYATFLARMDMLPEANLVLENTPK
jgi:hypothetical protein